MILAHKGSVTSWLRLALFLSAGAIGLGCDTGGVGHLSGQVISSGQTTSVDVNFSSINFPNPASDDSFVIKLANVSNHSVTFTINAKDPAGTTLNTKFPTGKYNLGGSSGNQFVAVLPLGAGTTQANAVSGFLNLKSFQIGQDASGNAAVAVISADFEATLEEDGFVKGDFEKDFTK